MTAPMSRISSVYNKLKTSGRTSVDSLENIPASCLQIFKSIEDLKKFLHKAKKWNFLPAATTLQSPDSGLPICDELCALHSRIEVLKKNFGRDVEDPLLKSFKEWEDRCDFLLKLRTDVLKVQSDYKKNVEKLESLQLGSPDYEKMRKQTADSEIVYFNKRETLAHELYKFSLDEQVRLEVLRNYFQELIEFFSRCTASSQSAVAPFTDLQTKDFFGTPIEDHLDSRNYSIVLQTCVSYLMRTHSYKQQGIFRMSGQVSKIELLRASFNLNKVDPGLLDFCGPDVVGDVLKQYLRDLPESLLTEDFVKRWLQESNTMTPQAARNLIDGMLPEPKRRNLIMLAHLLGQIVDCREESKMPPSNLATLFYMNLYHSGSKHDDGGQKTLPQICHFVSYLSENFSKIFPDEVGLFPENGTKLRDIMDGNSSLPRSRPNVPRRPCLPSECGSSGADSLQTEHVKLKAPPPVPLKSRRGAPPPPVPATLAIHDERRSKSADRLDDDRIPTTKIGSDFSLNDREDDETSVKSITVRPSQSPSILEGKCDSESVLPSSLPGSQHKDKVTVLDAHKRSKSPFVCGPIVNNLARADVEHRLKSTLADVEQCVVNTVEVSDEKHSKSSISIQQGTHDIAATDIEERSQFPHSNEQCVDEISAVDAKQSSKPSLVAEQVGMTVTELDTQTLLKSPSTDKNEDNKTEEKAENKLSNTSVSEGERDVSPKKVNYFVSKSGENCGKLDVTNESNDSPNECSVADNSSIVGLNISKMHIDGKNTQSLN